MLVRANLRMDEFIAYPNIRPRLSNVRFCDRFDCKCAIYMYIHHLVGLDGYKCYVYRTLPSRSELNKLDGRPVRFSTCERSAINQIKEYMRSATKFAKWYRIDRFAIHTEISSWYEVHTTTSQINIYIYILCQHLLEIRKTSYKVNVGFQVFTNTTPTPYPSFLSAQEGGAANLNTNIIAHSRKWKI